MRPSECPWCESAGGLAFDWLAKRGGGGLDKKWGGGWWGSSQIKIKSLHGHLKCGCVFI